MASAQALAVLALAQRDRFARLEQGTADAMSALWDRFRPVTDADLERWLRAAVPLMQGAQRASAVSAVGYLDAYGRIAGYPQQLDVDIDAVLAGLRDGIGPAEVYTRPVITVRKGISDGREVVDALRLGGERLRATASTDVMLAGREAGREAMGQMRHVVGYRRTVNPGACRYCLLCSTQRYHVRDLQPCHANCKCSPVGAPIYGDRDPGQILNRDLHAQLKREGVIEDETLRRQIRDAKKAGRDERVRSLSDQRDALHARMNADPAQRFRSEVTVHQHGELGPVLTSSDHAWTGPNDI